MQQQPQRVVDDDDVLPLQPPSPTHVWIFERGQLAETASIADDDDEDGEPDDDAAPLQHTAQFTLADHLAQNRANFDAMERDQQPLPAVGGGNRNPARSYLVTPITASDIPSKCLHPWFYTHCAGIDNDLTVLAEYLDVPDDWERRIAAAIRNPSVLSELNEFRGLGERFPEVHT